jgi:Flp pilus assembly pilin Flp
MGGFLMFAKLWKDEAGFVVSMELLFVATILVLGLIVGWTQLENSLKSELVELANAITALSQGYTISGQSGCKGATDGSQATDTAGRIGFGLTGASSPSNIDVSPCTGALVTP